MKIKIDKVSYGDVEYRADLLDLPGTPSIGEGRSKEEAVANLFYRLLAENNTWVRSMKLHEPLEIIETNEVDGR